MCSIKLEEERSWQVRGQCFVYHPAGRAHSAQCFRGGHLQLTEMPGGLEPHLPVQMGQCKISCIPAPDPSHPPVSSVPTEAKTQQDAQCRAVGPLLTHGAAGACSNGDVAGAGSPLEACWGLLGEDIMVPSRHFCGSSCRFGTQQGRRASAESSPAASATPPWPCTIPGVSGVGPLADLADFSELWR